MKDPHALPPTTLLLLLLLSTFSAHANALPTSCLEILENDPDAPTQAYTILPRGLHTPVTTLCDMDTDGGGWTLVSTQKADTLTMLNVTRGTAIAESDINTESRLFDEALYYAVASLSGPCGYEVFAEELEGLDFDPPEAPGNRLVMSYRLPRGVPLRWDAGSSFETAGSSYEWRTPSGWVSVADNSFDNIQWPGLSTHSAEFGTVPSADRCLLKADFDRSPAAEGVSVTHGDYKQFHEWLAEVSSTILHTGTTRCHGSGDGRREEGISHYVRASCAASTPGTCARVLDADGRAFCADEAAGWRRVFTATGGDKVEASDYEAATDAADSSRVSCHAFDGLRGNFVMRLEMGEWTDYYRPSAASVTLCEMLTTHDRFAWSASLADGAEFVVPAYYTKSLGGSANGWPASQGAGDTRTYLPFWGSEDTDPELGGCCHAAKDPLDAFGWNRGFTVSVLPVTAPCAEEGGEGAQPRLVEDETGVSGGGSLDVVFSAPRRHLSTSWRFVDAGSADCADLAGTGSGAWTRQAPDGGVCPHRHEFSMPVAEALRDCGFEGPQDGGNAFFYEAVVEVTAVDNASAVFGDEQNRTTLTSFRLRVEYAKNVSVEGSAGVFGAVIDRSALTEQTFDSVTQEFGWNLATSVQYPYYLEPVSAAVSGGHTFDTEPVVASSGDCSGEGTDAAPAACTQDFALSANETDDCFVPAGTTVTVTFQILCRPQYAGSCDLPEGNTTTASFSVETDDFCPRVVEVASITPALTTYAGSAGGTVSTNYILETTLFGRVTADVEAGLRAQRTTLTGLDIVSSCTGCAEDTVQPFANLGTAATAYGFAYVSGGTDNSATGAVETDFSFTLNTNSLSFDNDASTGEAQITLTAYVTVEYDTPSAQGLERSYRVQAVSGPGSIGSSATAQASVSSSTAGGSSSSAGSTVLGVSTGVAALAAVGVAAALAATVVGVKRRRRRHASDKLADTSSSSSTITSSSSTVELPACPPSPVPGMATDDLEAVRSAYSA